MARDRFEMLLDNFHRISFEERQQRLAQGIPLDAGSWQAICAAAEEVGLPADTLAQLRQKLA